MTGHTDTRRLDEMTGQPPKIARAHCALCKRGKGNPCQTFGTICRRCAAEMRDFITQTGERADAQTLADLDAVFH